MATKNNKPVDITKAGPQGYRELQQANAQNLTGISPEFQLMSQGIQQRYAPTSLYDARANAEQLVQSSMAESPTAWGESAWDEDSATEEQFRHLGDVRAQNQPWYSQVANGIAKGVLLAGTTFLDGTLGLLIGANTAIDEGRWSGLWDNDFSKAMQAVNEWSEEAMPNYYTEAEQNQPWYENIFTANFLGDKFIKNLGFTVGAFYSGGLKAGLLRVAGRLAMGTAKNLGASINTIKNISKASSMVASTAGALTSAVNEGRIEALNNSKDWYETQKMQIDDTYQQRLAAIQQEYEATRGHLSGTMETGFVDPAYEKYQAAMAQEQANYEATLGKLNEDRLKMGNADLLMNIPILTASNLIQFGKMYANGWRTGKRANNIVGNITEGYRSATTRGTGIRKAILNPLSEGTEEISQSAASRIAGDYYQTDVNNFYKAKTDPDAQQETLSWWKSFAQGINETVNEGSSWEEFFIGSLTGALGMPRFRGTRNQQGKFQSPVTLEGGILGELRENREQMDREQQIVDYMNNRLQSPEFRNYYQGLSRHNYYQAAMDQAIQDDDEFAFKNAEQAQFISDVSMFDAAGKIEDLTTLINSAYDTSDENLESIARNTTSVITAEQQAKQINDTLMALEELAQEAQESGDQDALDYANTQIQALNDQLSNLKDVHVGPFTDQDGNPLYATEQGKEEMVNKLTKTKNEMLGQIDDYVKTKIDLQGRLPQNIGDDQLEELIFLQTQVNNWDKRGEEMTPVIKGILTEASESLRTLASAQELTGAVEDSEAYNSNAEFIEKLVQDKTPKQLMQILSHPGNSKIASQISNIIGAYGNDVINNLDKQNVIKMLDDIVKIGKSKDLYQKRLQEYIANPTAQIQAHEDARDQQDNSRANADEVSRIDRINNSSVPDIVQAFEDGDLDLDDSFDDLLGGVEEDSEARDKVEHAREILDIDRRTRDELEQLASTEEISERELDDALALLSNSRAVSESADEFLDLDTEAFNDISVLDSLDTRETLEQAAQDEGWSSEDLKEQFNDAMSQRLDAAKNIISTIKSRQQQVDDELREVPSPTPAPQPIDNTGSTQTGHDPVDKNDPVNAPVVQQDNATEANRVLTDKTLAKYGHSREQSPQLAKDLDNIFSYVDRCIAKGVSDKEILDAISKTQTYQRLEQLQYPMKSLVQRAIELKKQGRTETPQGTKPAVTTIDQTPDTSASYETEIDGENKRANEYQSTEAYTEATRTEGTTTSMGRTNGTYNYWRPTTTELPIHRERGNNTPYWQTVNSPARERYQAIYEYLKSNGAFDRVNNDKVKKGDEVYFGISKELSEKVGKPVILLLNSNNEVIGDLPMPEDSSFNSYVGLPQLYARASEWYQKNHESLHTEGNDIAVIPGYKSNVARNMVGKPQYTSQDERHTLNQISTVTTSDGSQKQVPFRLGIAIANADSDRIRIMSDAGRSKSQGASPLERTIIAPLRAVKGQPFLLMPTSSDTRAFVPVPIMMPRFDASNPTIANSSLGQEVSKKVQELATIPNNTDQIMKWIDSIQELLSIPEIHVNFSNVTFTEQGRAAQDLIVTIKKPGETKQTTLYKGPQSEDVVSAVLNGLSGSMFQVSRKYINDTYNDRSYNEMIGELAETNLPIGATHTINDWFTIDPIVDRKQQKAHSPKSTRVNPTQTQGSVVRFRDVSGNSYYMTSSNRLYMENLEGNDTELLGDKYNFLKAHAYGARIGEPLTRPYDTPWGYYNPQTGKFQSKESSEKPIAIKKVTDAEYNQISESSSKITFNPSDHSYTVNGKPVDMSVTQWVHRNDQIEPETEGILGYLEISGRLGTEVDTMARKFFEGEIYDSPLLSKEQNIAVREQIQRLKEELDSKFGKGTWRAITDENMLRVAGTIKTPEGVKTIAGTMDMLIQDSKGNFHIIDFKTKRAKVAGQHGIIGDTKSNYDSQVSIYAKLLQENNPLLKGKITGSYLAIFNNFYNTPKGGRSNETGYVTYTEENGWIYAQVGESDRLFLHEQPDFNPATFNRLQLVDWDRTLPDMSGIGGKKAEVAPQPQVSREEALASLKKMGLLNKKERNAALDKLSDDRLIQVAGLPKLKARQTLEKFDTKIKDNMDSDAINAAFDSIMGTKPLNREVTEQMSREKSWSRESEIEKMSKVLPQLGEDGRVRVVDGLIRIARSGNPAYAWGQFQNGVITLSDRAARGTMYHESFHFVTQTLLSQKELNDLYSSAEKQYGKLKRLELEEKLAEDFREFMQSYEDDGVFKNIFKTLKHIIKSLLGKETITNKLFHDIRRGNLASRSVGTSNNTLYRKDPMTLTQELNELRRLYSVSHSKRFQDEVKRFNGKVNRNWDAAHSIIDRYGLRDVAYVFEGQYGAAKIGVQSLKEFTKKADRLKAQIQDAYEAELSDDERLSNQALEEQEAYYREVEQYHREKLDYGRLSQEQKDYITERGLTNEEYNSMTPQEKEVLFRCMY